MTENEALKLMESLVIDPKCELVKTLDFKATVIRALEDLQQYRAIGTIEEFKALKEKSVAKKPIQDEHFQYDYSCPCCGGKLAESVDDNCCLEEEMAGWCPYCGQKLDWQ